MATLSGVGVRLHQTQHGSSTTIDPAHRPSCQRPALTQRHRNPMRQFGMSHRSYTSVERAVGHHAGWPVTCSESTRVAQAGGPSLMRALGCPDGRAHRERYCCQIRSSASAAPPTILRSTRRVTAVDSGLISTVGIPASRALSTGAAM